MQPFKIYVGGDEKQLIILMMALYTYVFLMEYNTCTDKLRAAVAVYSISYEQNDLYICACHYKGF